MVIWKTITFVILFVLSLLLCFQNVLASEMLEGVLNSQISDSVWFLEVSRVIDKSKKIVILREEVNSGDSFSIKYTHSVQLTPVEEIFTISKSGEIVLSWTIFESVGFGLPDLTLESKFLIENGKVILYDINKKIDKIFLRVSFLNNHFLIIKEKEINLRDIAEGGDLIEIEILKNLAKSFQKVG